jgi:heavy metal translocating P-type ATPase
METLLALGILSAYSVSLAQVSLGRTHVYFDTAAAIVTLVLAGKLIERAAKDRASRSISMLYRLMPRKVRMMSAAGERFVSIEALAPGEVFVVKAGERIPADGQVLEGNSYADESLLSGEAAPVAKRAGDFVVSGSLNAGGVMKVRATRTGQESTLAQIICLVERALGSRTPIERTVDQISRIFVPTVVCFAVVVFAVLATRHAGIAYSLMRATTILVIACPCALGLATPLAITAAVGSASAEGILISDSRVLETICKVDTVVLDKTGTVTRGDFQLLDVALARSIQPALAMALGTGRKADPQDELRTFHSTCLPLLAGVEAYSEHLLGRAITAYASERRIPFAQASAVEVRKGEGICGHAGGRWIFAGNLRLVSALDACVPKEIERRCEEWQKEGRTVAFFGWDGQVQGLLAFGDQVKPGAAQMVRKLRARGINVSLVSGDARHTVAVVAHEIGVDGFTAEATPAMKATIIEQLQKSGKRVAVIGDGVNDAPALAQADLGIALGTGADIAMNAAPVVLVSGSLSKVDDVFRLAERSTRVVRQNLFWAFAYNVAGISLAAAGVLTPIIAAGAMLFSSASVVGNSMRLTQRDKYEAGLPAA